MEEHLVGDNPPGCGVVVILQSLEQVPFALRERYIRHVLDELPWFKPVIGAFRGHHAPLFL